MNAAESYRSAEEIARRLSLTAFYAALLVLLTLCTSVAYAAGDANQANCEEAGQASPGFRSYLPDCRAYELVSPPYKEGGVLLGDPAAISASGEQLVVGVAGATAETENEPYDPNRSGDIAVYHLARTRSGWSYAALNPPAARYERSALLGISSDSTLSSTLWGAQAGVVPHKEDIYMRVGSGETMFVGPGEIPGLASTDIGSNEELRLVGASNDLTHSVFTIVNEPGSSGGHHDVWPGDSTEKQASSLYEYVYEGTASLEPSLVGVRNEGVLKGSPHLNEGAELVSQCGTQLGSGEGGSQYNAVSADGGTVYFTAQACAGAPLVNELYARIEQARTVAISEPSKQDCEVCNTTVSTSGARFVGASRNGQRAYFTTEQALLPGQEGNNIYEYDFAAQAASASDPDGRIALVSTGGTKPEVQGVVRVSEDGSRVYFVAKGTLTGANAEGHSPQSGADNLYVYEPDAAHPGSSHVVFVATLLSATRETEAASEEEAIEAKAFEKAVEFWEAHCPPAFSNFSCIGEVEAVISREESALGYFDISETLSEDKQVWQTEDERPAQATPDGRFLVFASSEDLTTDDTSHVPQIFEYDAGGGASGNGGLTRVSIGQGGSYDKNGNVNHVRDAPHIPVQPFSFSDLPTAAQFGLAVSDDGSRVFFTSTAPLTPLAVSGEPSVFEYSKGDVYLVSDGADATLISGGTPTVQLYGTNSSGSDVFFTTADPLVPQVADSQESLYDAREGGGFPAPALPAGCERETCRGGVGQTPVVDLPTTSTQAGAEDLVEPIAKAITTPKSTKVSRLSRALRACNRLHGRRRSQCRAHARRRYAAAKAQGARGRRHATVGGRR